MTIRNLPILSDGDIANLNTAIEQVETCKQMCMKGRKDVALEAGGSVAIYHLGQHNDVIRMDLRGGIADES